MMRSNECFRMRGLLQREPDEQTSEQQDFRRQEQPHADFPGVELLLERREMVLQPWIVLGVVFAELIRMVVRVRISRDGLVHLALASRVGSHTVHASKQDRNRSYA
jgi:hypothetical protein